MANDYQKAPNPEEHRSIGAALVDVIDAGLTWGKAEVRSFTRKISEIVKAKGLGVVFLLAALGPIFVAVIFLLMGLWQALVALGLPHWGASFIMFLISLLTAGLLAFLGIKRLGAKVDG